MTKRTLNLTLYKIHIHHPLSIKILKNTSIISFLVTENQLKDTSDVTTLNYHKLSTFHTTLKINFRNFAKKL